MAMNGHANGMSRATEVQDLLDATQELIVPFIKRADDNTTWQEERNAERPVLVDAHSPQELKKLVDLELQDDGQGRQGFIKDVEQILRYSVNPFDQGFMDKLYTSPSPVGLAAELLLATLNTNVHVYQVSPVLTLIEKKVTLALARLFGYTSEFAGGVSQPGGSASNASSIVIARNTLHPETKKKGLQGRKLVLLTSEHGHYSLEKAAQMFGFGSDAVLAVPVDDQGRMIPAALEECLAKARKDGLEPFYVNATAGTTVMGSYDPISEIADICDKNKLWLHVDACWGGAVAFSPDLRKGRLDGIERADSIAFNPHKMLGMPITCSVLLAKDLRQLWSAMTLPAGYLFHNDATDGLPDTNEMYDLADLTPQCGRKADMLKLNLSWRYYGSSGFRESVEEAFRVATHLYNKLKESPNFELVSPFPLPCTQVCFFYARDGQMPIEAETSKQTAQLCKQLVSRGFLVDFAPGPAGKGKMIRAVVNIRTQRSTVERLVREIEALGAKMPS